MTIFLKLSAQVDTALDTYVPTDGPAPVRGCQRVGRENCRPGRHNLLFAAAQLGGTRL